MFDNLQLNNNGFSDFLNMRTYELTKFSSIKEVNLHEYTLNKCRNLTYC